MECFTPQSDQTDALPSSTTEVAAEVENVAKGRRGGGHRRGHNHGQRHNDHRRDRRNNRGQATHGNHDDGDASCKAVFERFANEDGLMDAKRIQSAMNALGHDCSRVQVTALLQEFDVNADGVLSCDEFANLLGKHEDFCASVTDDVVSEIHVLAQQFSADIARYRLLGRYLFLVLLFLIVLLAQRSSDGAASIGDSIRSALFSDASNSLNSDGRVTDKFDSSAHIISWLEAMVEQIYDLPTCGDSVCEGPEEFPSFNPAADAREFAPCKADCGDLDTEMISVRINFDDVEKLRNAYERRDAMIKGGSFAGASAAYWGIDTTTPLAGWNVCSRDKTEFGFFVNVCLFDGDVVIEGLPYRQDELDVNDASFGGSFDLELFEGNWELRIAYVDWLSNAAPFDTTAFPAVRGSLQTKNANDTEWSEREWFAPCPNADQCNDFWQKGLQLRDCTPGDKCYNKGESYGSGFNCTAYLDSYPDVAPEVMCAYLLDSDGGWCDKTCGYCEPSDPDDVLVWYDEQPLMCEMLSDPINLEWVDSLIEESHSDAVKAMFKVEDLDFSVPYRNTAEGAANMDQRGVEFWPPKCVADVSAENTYRGTCDDEFSYGYDEFGTVSIDIAESYYSGDGFCDALNNNIFGDWDGGDCCCSTCVDPATNPGMCDADGGCSDTSLCSGPVATLELAATNNASDVVGTPGIAWSSCMKFGMRPLSSLLSPHPNFPLAAHFSVLDRSGRKPNASLSCVLAWCRGSPDCCAAPTHPTCATATPSDRWGVTSLACWSFLCRRFDTRLRYRLQPSELCGWHRADPLPIHRMDGIQRHSHSLRNEGTVEYDTVTIAPVS